MRTNWVRERLRAGQPTIGSFMGLGSPNVAELLASAGFDWLVVETEHNGLDAAEIQHMLMAMDGHETIPLVRIPSSEPVFIQRALDMGALGIVVPLVRSADEARAIVAATRFPPQGTRSFGPLRASRYSLDYTDYLARANDNILVVLILETREALENLDAIAAVPGVDALYLGPLDLSLSLGIEPSFSGYERLGEAIDKMIAVCRAHGIASGMGDSSPEGVARWRERGCTLLGFGPEYSILMNTVRNGLARLRPEGGPSGA